MKTLFVLAVVGLSMPLWAQPSIMRSCNKCHGLNGESNNPTIPNLKGQNKGYLVSALKDYKSGNRVHQIMTPMAQTLSDKEIDEISQFYSDQK